MLCHNWRLQLFMDPYDASVLGTRFDPKWEPIRKTLGYAARFAQQMDLAAMRPRNALASTKYCLANPGVEYLVYAPQGGEFSVDLTAVPHQATARWFDPKGGTLHKATKVRSGSTRKFQAKWQGDAVLHIKA